MTAAPPVTRPTAPGRLRVYLGAAPGVGKTVAMLGEGRRRLERGTDVVIAVVDDHGRAYTAESARCLPVIPRRHLQHRGLDLAEMDLAAVLHRRPAVALVDELAHTNAPGSVHEKRWQDVQDLLAAGIDVVTTVNVQHLESLGDVVAGITGIAQTETVPDQLVRSADQVELVDMSPQALRRRMAHGHIYAADAIDTALGHYFQEGNLTALRELALLWVADRVDESLGRYRREQGSTQTWAARERIVVALPGGPEGPLLVRRGARIAGRATGRDLLAVHVMRSDGSLGASCAELERQRVLVESLGGTLHLVVGDDVAEAVLEFARGVHGTQILVGTSRHGRLVQLVRPSTSMAIVRGSGDIDVHVITSRRSGARRVGSRADPGGRRWSWVAAVLVPLMLSAVMLALRQQLNLPTVLLVLLLGVQATALIGGVLSAVVTAVIAGVLANVLFTPPFGSLTIAQPQNAFAIAVFVVVGVTVASIVDRSRAAASRAAKGQAQAQLLASMANTLAQPGDPLTATLEQARVGFGMVGAALLAADPQRGASAQQRGASARRSGPGDGAPGGSTLAFTGQLPGGAEPTAAADVLVPAGENDEYLLALVGHRLPAADQHLAEVVATQVVLAWERRLVAAEAEQTERLRQSDVVRTAILAAVSHDLRTPLATIKAAVSSLLDDAVPWSAADRVALLTDADGAADQLDGLLSNLLDLSRLQTGVLAPVRRPVSLDEVVYQALSGLPTDRLDVDVADDLPLIDTDPGLLERVVANLIGNALGHSPAGARVRVMAGEVSGRVLELRVVDTGPGVPEHDRERMFAPFQRLGDAPAGAGVGLGLAVARGLAGAVGATIDVDDTPGGGLTMVVSVPIAVTVESQQASA